MPICIRNPRAKKTQTPDPTARKSKKRKKIKEIRNRALEWQVQSQLLDLRLSIVVRRRAVGLSMLVRIKTAMQMRCCFVVADAKLVSTLDAGMALADRCYAIRKEHAVVVIEMIERHKSDAAHSRSASARDVGAHTADTTACLANAGLALSAAT